MSTICCEIILSHTITTCTKLSHVKNVIIGDVIKIKSLKYKPLALFFILLNKLMMLIKNV